MYLAVMVGKFVKQDVREWCPSTTGPLLPTMTDSGYLVLRDVLPEFHNIPMHTERRVPRTLLFRPLSKGTHGWKRWDSCIATNPTRRCRGCCRTLAGSACDRDIQPTNHLMPLPVRECLTECCPSEDHGHRGCAKTSSTCQEATHHQRKPYTRGTRATHTRGSGCILSGLSALCLHVCPVVLQHHASNNTPYKGHMCTGAHTAWG